MMWENLTFLGSLMGCLIISGNYRILKKTDEKKLFGACFGFLVIFVVCGEHIIHPMFITLVNILLIIQDDKRFLHMKSLAISFLYLALMHLGIICVSKTTINIHMILTLRLVGLCFELNTSYLIKNRSNFNMESQVFLNENVLNRLKNVEEISCDLELTDILAYTYNFIGILNGPYYTWKTFKDYFELPLENYEIINLKISRKIDNIPVTFVMYIWLNIFYPLNTYYFDDSTFDLSTFWCCYNIPRLVIVYLHYYMITSISEAICIEAGLGVYPATCLPEPGFGPTRNFDLLQQMKKSHYVSSSEKYNYNTVKIFGEYLIFSNAKMRKSLKYCEMTTQYWFWTNIYRRIPFNHKYLKTVITLAAWGIWSGVNLSNTILVSTLLMYIYVEDIYGEVFEGEGYNIYRNAIHIGTCLISKTMCFIYITPLLYNMEAMDVINYYNSTRWSFHLFLIVLLISGCLFKTRQQSRILCTVKQ